MADLIDRLKLEASQLDSKIANLEKFFTTKTYTEDLDKIDSALLDIQHSNMVAYLHVLNTRISRL